jgi:dolichol-phosphate mannosyltransferase
MKNEKNKINLSLVVPTHNASVVISNSLKEYSSFLSSLCDNYEIIVVCNACTDDTVKIVSTFSKRDKRIRCIELAEPGKGLAVITGMKKANYEIIGFIDADNAFDLNSVGKMIRYLNENDCDCIIASKWLGRNIFQIEEPLTRKILAVGWKALTILLFQMRFHDTQAGCKFLKKRAFESIDKEFICKGFDFDVELLYRIKKKGFSIKEVRIPVLKSFKFSTFRLKYVPLMFFRLLKLRVYESRK